MSVQLCLALPSQAQAPPSPAAHLSAAEAGARFGQAQVVARYCPGGHVTQRAASLGLGYKGAARTVFDTEVAKVIESWTKTMSCQEADPETGRMNVNCRRIKLMNCRQAWLEIGPEGRVAPGLVELSLDGVGSK